jgi:tetratricopeptide (TPR) repeat protein
MYLALWCDKIIKLGFILLFGLVPLLLTPWNYELFEFNKMMAVYAITVVVAAAWLVKSIANGKLEIARTPLDIPIALFMSSLFVSSLFSIDPHVSWYGYYSRFNGGMFSILSYVLLYYVFVSNNTTIQQWNNITIYLRIALSSAIIVSLYGVLERLGIDRHLWVQDVQSRVFSTLGQPNWLAAYLAALAPLSMAFALKSQSPSTKFQTNSKSHALNPIWSLEFVIWCFISALFFLVLLSTRSRSGLLGFVVADVVFWCLLFLRSNRYRFLPSFFILHSLFFLIVFFNGTYVDSIDRWFTLRAWSMRRANKLTIQQSHNVTLEATPSGTLLETGGTESGTIRKYVWQGAINAWNSSWKTRIIGTGTETFAFAFYRYRPKAHNMTSEWDFLYNKAHNEYLNYLATTGILGLGSYLLFIGACMVLFVKFQIPSTKSQLGQLEIRSIRNYLPVALFAGWLSILITNFFGFSVVVVQLFLFLFPAMVIGEERVKSQKQDKMVSINMPRNVSIPYALLASLVLLALLVLLVLLALGWYSDTLYATGVRRSRAGLYDTAVDALSRATGANPLEPLFADELGTAYAGLAASAVSAKDATSAARLVSLSLSASDRAVKTSPRNVNFWKTRTKIYYTFASFDPAFNNAAIEALEQAWKLSPNDPKITYNLSILYGRKGDNAKAIKLLQTTIDLKPNYRDGYYALWVFYTEIRDRESARQVLQDYLARVDPGDKDFLEKLEE